jgi:hypothetical protein
MGLVQSQTIQDPPNYSSIHFEYLYYSLGIEEKAVKRKAKIQPSRNRKESKTPILSSAKVENQAGMEMGCASSRTI